MTNLTLHNLRRAVSCGCSAMFSDTSVSRFRRILLPSSSTVVIGVDDGYSIILWNVDTLYWHTRRHILEERSPQSPLCEPDISLSS
jgi:hypothetical protein